jgi:4-hydroxybenzoate polyprenyltransferase
MGLELFTDCLEITKKLLDSLGLDLFVSIEKTFSFLAVSSIFIGVAGFFETYIGYLLIGLYPNLKVCFAVFLMTFSVYSLDKLTDSEEDLINMPERVNFISGRRNLILYCSITAYVLAAVITFLDKPLALPIILVPLMANAIYGSKLIPGLPRLKDIPVMKNVVVALSWSLVTTLLPAVHSGNAPLISIIMVFYFMTTKMFINTVLFDIRDVKGDRDHGVRTIPVILGEIKTVSVLLVINSTLLPWLIFVPSNMKLFVAAMILYGYAYILYFRERRNPRSLDFFVDGEWMLSSIMLLTLRGIGLLA